MTIPSKVRAGDILQWRDSETQDVFGNAITSTEWSVTYYLRTNTAAEGATARWHRAGHRTGARRADRHGQKRAGDHRFIHGLPHATGRRVSVL